MATHYLDISAALDKHLNDLSGKPSIAWQNIRFEPTIGTLYVRPENIQDDTIATTENDLTEGTYQLDIFAPAGEGKNEAIAMTDTLTDRFKQDSEFAYNGVTVRVQNTALALVDRNENGWYHIRLNIRYYSFTARR